MTPKKIRRRPILEQLEARRLLDGELDPSWGAGGVVEPIVEGSSILRLHITPDGKPVAIGSRAAAVIDATGGSVPLAAFHHHGTVLAQPDGRYVLATQQGIVQYAADGKFVKQFTGGTLSAVPSGMESRWRDFAVAPNGDVLLAGQVGTSLFGADEAVVHWSGVEIWSADGQLKGSIQDASYPHDIQVAGFADGWVYVSDSSHTWRYLPGGERDTNFAAGPLSTAPGNSAVDMAVDQYGRVYVWQIRTNGTSVITRYKPNGARDTEYGVNGVVDTGILALNGAAASLGNERVFVAPDGRVYVGAITSAGAIAVGRLTAAGAKDTTWGTGGVATTAAIGNTPGGRVNDFAILPDGDLLVAAENAGGVSSVARFQGPGTDAPSPVNLVDGKLTVTGTSGNDVITFRSNSKFGVDVTVNGQTHSFSELQVREILVLAGDGHDSVDARELAPLPNDLDLIHYEMVIDGGNGNDVLVGHQGDDRIRGEAGDDKVHGWGGNDWLSGNAQKDRIYGGAGDDVLSGNGGRDRLVGEDGNDTLSGGDQPDLLIGLAGDDSLAGDGGHDRLDGGAGRDFLYGAGGDDTFWARDGEVDQLVGGMAAIDRAQVDEDDVLAGIEELLA